MARTKYLSVAEASEKTGFTGETLRRWCQIGQIKKARKYKGQWRIPESFIKKILRAASPKKSGKKKAKTTSACCGSCHCVCSGKAKAKATTKSTTRRKKKPASSGAGKYYPMPKFPSSWKPKSSGAGNSKPKSSGAGKYYPMPKFPSSWKPKSKDTVNLYAVDSKGGTYQAGEAELMHTTASKPNFIRVEGNQALKPISPAPKKKK